MIARLQSDRHWQLSEPFARQRKFARGPAHRQIAGAQHGGGAFARDLGHEPVERGAILVTEMQVTDVEQHQRRRHHIRPDRISQAEARLTAL